MDIGLERVPLAIEQELQVGIEIDVVPQLTAVALQHLAAPAQTDVGIGPVDPRGHAEVLLDGHIQCVVAEPAGILGAEGRNGVGIALPAAFIRLAQHAEAALINAAVIDIARVAAPAAGRYLAFFEKPVLNQQVEVDKIGVAGVDRKALVGAVAIAGRPQRKHLPEMLAGGMKKIGKFIGSFSQRTDAVGRG